MEALSRKDIKELFDESVAVIVTEFKATNDAHEKDLLRLSKQSAEHYENIKSLEAKMATQIATCQSANYKSQENTGIRAGKVENDISRIDQKIIDIEDDIKEMKENKKFNISQWLVVAGLFVVIILEVMQRLV